MTADRNWDAEMKKIDKQLESISDEALFSSKQVAEPAKKQAVLEQQKSTSTLGVFLRLTLATALGVGVLFWPYSSRCGLGLAGYLGAVIAVAIGGVWSAVWTWRHRAAKAHILSLLLLAWGVTLAAIEILPRAGYAKPDATRPAGWSCPAR